MIVQMWCGIALQVTEQIACTFPPTEYETFPDNCCGTHGLAEVLVPDYILIPQKLFSRHPSDIFIKISPACWIHDMDWELAAPTWDDFHASNSRLYANVKAIVETQTETESHTQNYALRFPAIYAQAVDTVGRKHFWQIKKEQEHEIPASAAWLLR